METEAIDNQANLVIYDNENENEIDDLGYQSDEYIEVAHEDDENNHSNGYAKRGITRLCKFRREYGKPGGVKLSVTFDALNRILGKHRALFLSFLGDIVHEHIGLQILSWKKVGPEARNKLWDEITRYFDVDLTVRKLVMNRLGQLLRNFRRKLRQTYILPNQDTPSKLNEVHFVNYTTTEEYKVKSAKTKMARSKKENEDKFDQKGPSRLVKALMPLVHCICKGKGKLCKRSGESGVDTRALPKDCYKVSIDKSLVDAAFIPDVGSNSCTTVLDAVGGFVAWPKNQVVLDPKATPPSTIQMITGENKTAPKVQTKRKNVYVSSDAMQKEANKKRHNVPGRQTQGYVGNGAKGNATGTWVNRNVGTNTTNQEKVVRYYNCQGEGHMARHGQDSQELTTTTIFQTNDLDAFDSDCDEVQSASAVLMDKLSAYDSDILSKHDALSVNYTEETLKLDEESKLKMLAKQNDPIAQEKKPIRRIHQGRYGVSVPALTKDHRGIKLNTPYPEDQYAVLEIWNEYNILEDIKRGPYSKKSPIRRIQSLDTPYRTDFQTL
ncbi:hypothetical protein Tco_0990566 [Tanacetum coccineum]|uniref:Transposase Tnp1/En/Spm-like domain-containing protein n=1 Tax=Tanacetum coccineum TaxID=301880 RepID=A0ABQ5EYH0_9ASTR